MALVQLQVRSDTAAAWTAANPVLLAGEPGFETDTGKLKIGDGVRNWATLPYTSGVSLASAAPPATGSAVVGTSGLAARADHSHALPSAVSCQTLTVASEATISGPLNLSGELRGGTHKHVTGDVTGLSAFVVSQIASTIKAGSNVALSFDSVTNTLTVSSTATATGGGTSGVTSINGQTGAVTLSILSAADVVSQISTALQTLDGITETYDATKNTITLGLTALSGGTYGGTPTTTPLAFLAVPQPATAVGGAATFSATATGGSASIAYQWEVSTDGGTTWADVSGATSATLSLTGLTAAEHGRQYRVKATSGSDTVFSTSATLTTVTLSITTQPTDAAVTVGQAVNLSVVASSSGSITYQWQSSTDAGVTWSNVGGATSATYSFTPSVVVAGTLYRTAVTANSATIYTRAATVTATDPPLTISLQPVDTIAASCAASLSFDYTYAGAGSVTMQWQRRANATSAWVNVSGATGKVLSLTGLVGTDSGAQCRASATVGTRTVYSSVATLTVPGLAITAQPESATAYDGQAIFNVEYTGACGTVEIRWEVRQPTSTQWAIIPGQTTATLALVGMTRANSGQAYRAVIRVGTQVVTSSEAILTVENVSGFASVPASTTAAAGEEVTFTWSWSNDTDTLLRWWEVSRDNGVTWDDRYGSEASPGNSGFTFTFAPLPSDNGSQYRVVVKVSQTGFVYRSPAATLTVTGSLRVTDLGVMVSPTAIAGDGAGGMVVAVTPCQSNLTTTPGQRSILCYVSSDGGASFSPATLPVSGAYADVACGASGTWLAICPLTGTIAVSTNRGRVWSAATVDVPFGAPLDAANRLAKAFIDYLPAAPIPYVAATRAGVYTSSNGITWTRRSALTSPTSSSWTGATTPVTYGSGKYLTIGPAGVWTSTNGTSWTLVAPSAAAQAGDVNPTTSAVTSVQPDAVLAAGGWFVGLADRWLGGGSTKKAAFSLSSDGLSYTVLSQTVSADVDSHQSSYPLQVGDGIFHAARSGTGVSQLLGVASIYPSEDADTWVMPQVFAPMRFQSRQTGYGKNVAYVSPNRIAIAGHRAATADNTSMTATVAVFDVRTPFSGTVPNASAPTAPQPFSVTPGNQSAVMSWAPPLSTGGLPITSYVAQYKLASGSSWTTASLARPIIGTVTITGLTNGVVYDFRVAAVTAAGTGVYATKQATPALSAPGAPTGLTVTPTGPAVGGSANSRYSLSWTAPASNGGASITEYVVQAQYVGPSAFPGGWTTLPYGLFAITASGTSATVTPSPRFVGGIKMAFRVAAKNSVGTGAFSAESGLVSMT